MYTVPPITSSGPYVTMSEVLRYAQQIKPDLPASAITSYMLNAATEIIENRTQAWQIFAGSIFIDGSDSASVVCPITPILTLTNVNIYDQDGSIEALVVGDNHGKPATSGPFANKQAEVNWEKLSGVVRRVNDVKTVIDINTLDESPIFGEGLNNVELVGTFGRGPYQILQLLQILLVVQQLQYAFPKEFRGLDVQREKLGDYSYDIAVMERTQNLKNQKLTLEGYIEFLFKALPTDYNDTVLAI